MVWFDYDKTMGRWDDEWDTERERERSRKRLAGRVRAECELVGEEERLGKKKGRSTYRSLGVLITWNHN